MPPCVFVVDDDHMAMTSVRALVEAHGFTCHCFGSAEDFLASYDPAWCGCLVTDITMGGMSGFELLREMSDRHSKLPVILITGGHAALPSEPADSTDRPFAFLKKPYAGSALLEAIGNAMAAADPCH